MDLAVWIKRYLIWFDLTKIRYNKQPTGCEAQLAVQLYKYFSMTTYKPSKLGQTDLVFVL